MDDYILRKQFEGYTKQEVEKAKLAHELQVMVDHYSDRGYKDILSNKLLPNCLITTHDITNTRYMLGPDLTVVKVKAVRNKPSRVYTEEYVTNTEDLYKLHKFVTLTADFMFVNGDKSVITSARKLNSVTIEPNLSQTINFLVP